MHKKRTLEMKRRLTAWLLLSVFVPMMVMTVLHSHESTTSVAACADCDHHVAHAGHFSILGDHNCDCVLCQFTSIVFLGSTALGISILMAATRQQGASFLSAPVKGKERQPSLRAPPTILG